MSLLTIIQNAASRIGGITRPTVVVNATDPTQQQLLALAQEEGKALAREGTWRALTSEATFTTVAAASQTSSIPSDFDWYIPDTMFNRTRRRRVTGPLTPEQWQLAQATLVTYVNPAFRMRGTTILISPTPAAGETVAYEYITAKWCQSNASVAQAAWTADTDTPLLDEELHTLGIIWRWRKSKGLDYAEDFNTYNYQVQQALLRDGGRPRLSMSSGGVERYPTSLQIPETLTFS